LLELGGSGWREVYVTYCQNEVRAINTPKTTIIEPIYEKFIGLKELSNIWTVGGQYITDLVVIEELPLRGNSSITPR